jgi:signal transduction histidine kinase
MTSRRAVAIVALALVAATALAALDLSTGPPRAPTGIEIVLQVAIGLSFALCGVLVCRFRPDTATGPMMLWVAAAWFAEQLLSALPGDGFYSAQLVISGLWGAILVHLILGFPSGRLTTSLERVTVGLAYFHATLGHLVANAFEADTPFGARNVLVVREDPALAETLRIADTVLVLVMLACVLVAIALRWRRASAVERFALAPIHCVAVVLALVSVRAPLTYNLHVLEPTALFDVVVGLTSVLIPLALLVGALRWQLARQAVAELVLAVGRPLSAEGLRDALATALRDPTLAVAYRRSGRTDWVDGHGRAVTLPRPDDPARAIALIEGADGPVAALVHDRALLSDPVLLPAVCAAARMTLDNQRLTAELQAQLSEVRASRARVVEAADAERRRVERNLHDGAQQRLLSLAMALKMAHRRVDRTAEPELENLIVEAERQLTEALQELRELARGLNPSVLADEGLAAALDSLSEHSPIPVHLSGAPLARLPETAEAAAYYVVSEAVANAAKHAHASLVDIDLRLEDGVVCVEVADDGDGGAVIRRGAGLEGLLDRVRSVGGEMTIDSDPGHGTQLRASIPCA